MEKMLRKTSEKPSVSVLQANELFVKKILSRNSSIGDNTTSHHLSNFKTRAEVPFKWESQPGKPKDPPKGTAHQFTGSPPAVDQPQSAVVARGVHAPPRPVAPNVSGGRRFWKKLSKRRQKQVVEKVEPAGPSAATRGLDNSNNNGSNHLIFSVASSSPRSCCSSSSVTSASSSASNTNCNNAGVKPRSRLQNLAWGCIKRAF
ncbi:hypothetical protein PanWU01x14_038790 [Parasponia andersonii]|uniref:Uncharacterized protein n=1 Tax=Parasponia andersonii TaxID=3476 RepID=A0A2P5DRL6_PARAD|nr:hypothetical protein PanWU01x14_038790 [Parasponia andersonii]